MIGILLEGPLTIEQLARRIEQSPSDTASDVEHLLKSLKHTSYEAWITPAQCRKCGFEFERKRLRSPSKCPKCRGTWVRDATIEVREKG